MTTVGKYSSLDVRPLGSIHLKTSKPFQFSRQYLIPPRIVPGLAGLDIGCRANIRVKTYATDVTTKSLVMHNDSWNDTINYSVDTNWLQLAPAALDFQCGKFSIHENRPWDETQEEASRRIDFAYPFATPPKVLVFISKVDIGNDSNFRVKTYASDVDTMGFTIYVTTWGGTKLYGMEMHWVAHPEDRENTFSTTFNTMDVRPPHLPQLQTRKDIYFDGQQFDRLPEVFMALSTFDIGNRANFRLKIYASNLSVEGLTWHVDSWLDTVVYSGGVILALA